MSLDYITIRKIIRCRTGLRIGGSKEDIEIGGLDNPVIRDALTKLPYIPGSSIKGKLRSLLEWKTGKVSANGTPHGCRDPKCLICAVFGPHGIKDSVSGPTRIIVRDAMLCKESREELTDKLGEKLYTELKQEVSIDRNTGKASGPGPRTMERVPAGAKFELNIVLRIFERDSSEDLVKFVEEGIDLLGKDALGSSGTRGYGWVEILDNEVVEQ